MIRQPNECLCFGGRCWGQFCPNRKKKATAAKHERPKDKNVRRHPSVLTLSDSLKRIKRSTDDE